MIPLCIAIQGYFGGRLPGVACSSPGFGQPATWKFAVFSAPRRVVPEAPRDVGHERATLATSRVIPGYSPGSGTLDLVY